MSQSQDRNWDWEFLAQNNVKIDSQELFDGLLDYFSIPAAKEFMSLLSEENTVKFYIGLSGYQISWTGKEDFFIVQ